MRPLTDHMIEQALAAQIRLAWIRDLSISINIPPASPAPSTGRNSWPSRRGWLAPRPAAW